jgi:ComF family protein
MHSKLFYKFKNLFFGLESLVLPELCMSCLDREVSGEGIVCVFCIKDLLFTNYFDYVDNPLYQKLNEKVKIERASALWYYYDHSIAQNLVHNFKYSGFQKIGENMGKVLGQDIVSNNFHKGIDAIMYVPMTDKKKHERGFNQAEVIANQISIETKLPILHDVMLKLRNTKSQTVFSKKQREKNADILFKVVKPMEIKNKHILLVDDVITTGSTIASCSHELLMMGASKISVVGLAAATSHGDLLETAF